MIDGEYNQCKVEYISEFATYSIKNQYPFDVWLLLTDEYRDLKSVIAEQDFWRQMVKIEAVSSALIYRKKKKLVGIYGKSHRGIPDPKAKNLELMKSKEVIFK